MLFRFRIVEIYSNNFGDVRTQLRLMLGWCWSIEIEESQPEIRHSAWNIIHHICLAELILPDGASSLATEMIPSKSLLSIRWKEMNSDFLTSVPLYPCESSKSGLDSRISWNQLVSESRRRTEEKSASLSSQILGIATEQNSSKSFKETERNFARTWEFCIYLFFLLPTTGLWEQQKRSFCLLLAPPPSDSLCSQVSRLMFVGPIICPGNAPRCEIVRSPSQHGAQWISYFRSTRTVRRFFAGKWTEQ